MRTLLTACFAMLIVASCTTVNVTPSGEETGGKKTAATASADKPSKKDEKKSPFKKWDEVLEDTKAFDGYFKTHLKRDNTLYVELPPDRLEKEFGMVMHYSRGVGVFNAHDGLPLSATQVMRFERHGDKVYLVHVNHRMTAEDNSPMRESLGQNTGNSIVDAFDIASEDSSSKALLLDVTGFFVSDYADISDQLKFYYKQKPVSFDKGRSYVSQIQAFPKNVEVDAMLTFKASDPPGYSSASVSDHRSVPVGVRYSLFALPEKPMVPRYGDDRVGYFLDALKDFSRDKEYNPYITYVVRWRLEKKDPSAKLSEPVQPIVFYVDRSVPMEYRKYVKAGIEAWNKGFEAAGFKNAIVARDAPDDSTWSAEDIRYSTVRWTAAHSMGYAIGPRQSDPRTGEILNADILISSTFVRSWANDYSELVAPEGIIERFRRAEQLMRSLPAETSAMMCLAELGKSHQIGLQYTALAAMDLIDGGKAMPEEYLGEAVKDLVMHEVGHTIGLRHNFKSSSAIPFNRINDKAYTRENGLASSVMDYNPTNISSDPNRQGHYNNVELGAYDVWAIQYGYTPIYVSNPTGTNGSPMVPVSSPEEERTALSKIASRAAEPLLAYNTDEDAQLGSMSVDPKSSTWDLSEDPLSYAQDRRKLVDRILPRLESRLVTDGDRYYRLRGALSNTVFEQILSTLPLTKTIGGLYFVRDHKNDPQARPPFTPESAARQREVMSFISANLFAPDAFSFDASLLNKLAPNRLSHWGTGYFTTPIDYPIHAFVASGQNWILGELLDNGRLTRMVDNSVRTPGDVYSVAEMLQTLTASIWAEVANPSRPVAPNSFRRNLQRSYVDQLTRIMLDLRPSPSTPPAPEDARSLARLELTELSDRLRRSLEAPSLDRTAKAHLMESKVRIDEALDVSMTIDVK